MRFKAQPPLHEQPAPNPNSLTIIEPAPVTRFLSNFGKQGVAAWTFDPPLVLPGGVRAIIDSVKGTVTVSASGGREQCYQAEEAEPTW